MIRTMMAANTSIPPEDKAQDPEVIIVEDDLDGVSCDGGGGPLGHPRVWYSFDGQDMVECGYCDRLFVKRRAKGQAVRGDGQA